MMGCHPFYWNTTVSSEVCSNAELKNYTSDSFFHTVWNLQDPPCQSIEQLITTYEEIGKYDYQSEFFWRASYPHGRLTSIDKMNSNLYFEIFQMLVL